MMILSPQNSLGSKPQAQGYLGYLQVMNLQFVFIKSQMVRSFLLFCILTWAFIPGLIFICRPVRFVIQFPVPGQNLMYNSFPVLRWFATNETNGVDYLGSETMESIRTFIETKLGIITIKVSSKFVCFLSFNQ